MLAACFSSSAGFAFLFLGAITVTVAAVPPPPSPAPRCLPERQIDQARTLLEKEIVPKVPGLSVAVATNGAVVWAESFGYADLARKTKVTAATRFRIGSISKPLTAAGLMRLVERGQLDLDAPVQTCLPDYPVQSRPLTLRLLAGHLSGLRDYRAGEALSNRPYPDSPTRLRVFETDPLVAPPGEKFNYSGYNWDVIEAVMEHAAREDFVACLDESVLAPLHLSHTRAEQATPADFPRTQFYEADAAGAFVPGPPINVQHAWARGGYLSTAEDLVRFGSALLRPGFLRESSRETLFTSQKTSDGQLTGYGVGWFVYPKPKVFYHSGWTVGGLSILLLLPDSKTVVALLTNRGGLNIAEDHPLYFNVEEIGFKLAQIFAAPPSVPDSQHSPAK